MNEEKNTVQFKEENSKITITDVADALGISKTTVSRAISGKGRIGEATRQRVLDYISKNHYRPSVVAKGLANSKTYNIGWIIPGDSSSSDLPFFQRCMMGVSEVAAAENYDLLITMVFSKDISQLERVVRNRKVDGFIVGRTLLDDPTVEYLKKNDIPFVVIGSSNDHEVVQIDNDHINACRELTSILVMKGIKKPVLIGGNENHIVNRSRKTGYILGLESQGMHIDKTAIYLNMETDTMIERAVDEAVRKKADCIVCMDDRICSTVLTKLYKDGINVPRDIKIASFYNSKLLENNQPAITALSYDPKELGTVACKILFDYMAGKEIQRKVYLGYEVVLKGSTN